MHDVLLIGGGAIGLSLAYELSGRGKRVHVVERADGPGRESSRAGAGIVPPGIVRAGDPPLVQLAGHSARLHPQWSEQLLRETGIDNGYRVTGALYLAESPAARERVEQEVAQFRDQQTACEPLAAANLATLEPALAGGFDDGRVAAGYSVPGEAQLRNPRHIKALTEACAARGVTFTYQAPVESFDVRAGRIRAVSTQVGTFAAEQFCLAGGAWSGQLAAQLGLRLAVKPIRGQIALLAPTTPVIRGIVYVGRKYFVARDDGRILVGSTEEDVGFDKSTTATVIRELLDFALGLAPQLAEARVEQTWAGLRPFSADGLPYLGRAPQFENLFVAAGHYRWGLALSPITAVVMSQLMLGEPTSVDLTAFRIDR